MKDNSGNGKEQRCNAALAHFEFFCKALITCITGLTAFSGRHYLTSRWGVAVPDVAIQPPLALLAFPNNHILAAVERLTITVENRVCSDLRHRRAGAMDFNRFELDLFEPGINRALPECLDPSRPLTMFPLGGSSFPSAA